MIAETLGQKKLHDHAFICGFRTRQMPPEILPFSVVVENGESVAVRLQPPSCSKAN